MTTGIALVIAGVIMVWLSGDLTGRYIKRHGLEEMHKMAPEATMRMIAGKNIVPSWVSLLNMSGFTVIGVGALVLVSKLF